MENRFEPTPEEQQAQQAGWQPRFGLPFQDIPPPGARSIRHMADNPSQGLCLQVRDMLPALLENDGDIRPEMATAVYGHLSACSGCTREFEELQRVVALLEALPPAEMPMDYSEQIMQRIQMESLPMQQFAAPQPGSETQRTALNRIDLPTLTGTGQAATILGQTQQNQVSSTHKHQLWQQFTLAGMLTAMIAFFLSTAWGQQMLGANVRTLAAWLQQVGEGMRAIPLFGGLVQFIFAGLTEVGVLMEEAYATVGATAVRGLALDVALCAGAYYYLMTRRHQQQRSEMRSV